MIHFIATLCERSPSRPHREMSGCPSQNKTHQAEEKRQEADVFVHIYVCFFQRINRTHHEESEAVNIFIYICVYMYIYIYVYTKRERGEERERDLQEKQTLYLQH